MADNRCEVLVSDFVSSSDQISLEIDGVSNFLINNATHKIGEDQNPRASSTQVIQNYLAKDASNTTEDESKVKSHYEDNGDIEPVLDGTVNDSKEKKEGEQFQPEFRSNMHNNQWIHGLSLRQQRLKLFTPANEPEVTVDAEEEYIKMQKQLNKDFNSMNVLRTSNITEPEIENPALLQKKRLENGPARINEKLKKKQQKDMQSQQQQSLVEQHFQQKLPERQRSHQQLPDEPLLAIQPEERQEVSGQELEEQLSSLEIAEQLSGEKVAEQQLPDQIILKQDLSDKEHAEQPPLEQQQSDQHPEETLLLEQKMSDDDPVERPQLEQQMSDENSAENPLPDQDQAEEQLSEQQQSQKELSVLTKKRHSKHVEVAETSTNKIKHEPIVLFTVGIVSDEQSTIKRKPHNTHKTTQSHKLKRNKKNHVSDIESDKVVESQNLNKKKGNHKRLRNLKNKGVKNFGRQQELFDKVTESSVGLKKQKISSELLGIPTEALSLEQEIEAQLDALGDSNLLEIVAEEAGISKEIEAGMDLQKESLEILRMSNKKQESSTILPYTNQTRDKVLTSVTTAMKSRPNSQNERRLRKKSKLAENLKFSEIFYESNSIGRNVRVNTFATHILKSAMEIFDGMKVSVNDERLRNRIDWISKNYDAKYRLYLQDLLKHPIKTRLGTQKVILNSIDESERILKRLVNYVVADLDEKGNLRHNINVAQNLLDNVDEETQSQLTHACKKFGICKGQSGFSQFLAEVFDVLLQVNAEKFQIFVDAFTETAKYSKYDKIFNPRTCKIILRTITYIETENMDVVRTKLMILRNIISNRNKPLIVTKYEARYCRLNSTVALLEMLNILEENVPRTEDNIVDWGDVITVFKDWSNHNKPNIQDAMVIFVDYLKDTLLRLTPPVIKTIEKHFTRMLVTED